MQNQKLFSAIGLMSGTSMDGIDIAFLQSDGKSIIKNKKFSYYPYEDDFRKKISYLVNSNPQEQEISQIDAEFTDLNAKLVEKFLQEHKINRAEVDLIGFSGHTILHDPENSITRQIGSPESLEEKVKIHTIGHFRKNDIARGGQGAPLVPIYHFYMANLLPKPLAILNIGGVNNITHIPSDNERDIQAFDICFGNAPFDDLISKNTDQKYDHDGQLALSGSPNLEICEQILQNQIFYQKPPKSFDRNDFSKALQPLDNLTINDALASLAYLHAKILAKNIELFCKSQPKSIYICGGGLKNRAIMKYIKEIMSEIQIKSTSEIDFNPDQIEAQAFAFLAIREHLGLPIGVSLAAK